MELPAKKRLTGAVILVAIFVLFVPELLTGPRQAAPANTPGEAGLRRYTIDLDAQSNPAQPLAEPAVPAVALPPVALNPMQAAPTRATPGEAAAPEPGAPDASHAAATAVASDSKPVVATTSVVTKPATQTPPPPPPAASTAPTTPARVEVARPNAPPAEKGSFAVQLGSFSSRENADRLVHDMTAKGFSAFVAPITSNGRELFRVRVGPTRDRTQAESLAAQLQRIGQTGSIVPIS
jgi:DedD protein